MTATAPRRIPRATAQQIVAAAFPGVPVKMLHNAVGLCLSTDPVDEAALQAAIDMARRSRAARANGTAISEVA